ncbi:hypothetical protein GPECTOR_9g597 [Gonium pectorale]|uniref:Uncharacterized protein n=1 Tax=Gonium pectorale TaxID=33097 RepID=A0A150GRX5_GONPE|nr:hypothetical protein GPECTOR_9g597 [Gonium pectorale]|eukprot:KXZ52553.1 hypothetical protein GPECTOR_9g597 [Gonium pectorale]
MGQNQSTGDVLDAVNQVDTTEKAAAGAQKEGGTKLYKYVATASGDGNWELASSNARPRFYDSNEDSNTSGKKDFFLEIEQGDVDVHVDAELNYVLDVKQRRVTFSANETIYALKFPNDTACRAFGEQLNDAVFYNQYGVDNDDDSRAKVMDDYASTLFSKDTERMFEPMEVDTTTAQDDAAAAASDAYTPEKLKEKQAKEMALDEDAINGIIMGAGENNYLMRGRRFDVLRNLEGGGVEDKGVCFTLTPAKGAACSTPSLSTRKTRGTAATAEVAAVGAGFTPSKVLLTHGERRMNLLTPENRNVLHHADIEVGKIVSTFSFQKDDVEIPIADIASDYKAAQMEEHSQFLGLDQNRLCRWDLRDRRGVVQESPAVNYVAGKDYSRGTNFTCMATSGDGFVAVGSRDGRIRLYNSKTLTQAKTSIPGLGAPITAIDVTYDGKWVLATTDHYLMLVKTTYTDDKGRPANGFESRMGGRGSVPRLLRLKPEDAIKTQNAKFTKGKFTWITEGGQSERWIVAGCGRFSVVWNFTKIRTAGTESIGYGGLPTSMDYFLRAKEEEVVDVQFVHQKYMRDSEQAALVVATPHSLFNLA